MAVQPGLCRTWSETPKTGFLTRGSYILYFESLILKVLCFQQDLDISNNNLGPQAFRAVCLAMCNNSRILSLNIAGNKTDTDSAVSTWFPAQSMLGPKGHHGSQLVMMSSVMRKPVFGVSDQIRHTGYRAVHPQKMARGLKFWI